MFKKKKQFNVFKLNFISKQIKKIKINNIIRNKLSNQIIENCIFLVKYLKENSSQH